MLEQPNLKDLEKSLYSKFQEDGIWDIFLGIFLLASGLFMEFSSTAYIGIVAGVMIPLVVGMKKKITEPRLGVVAFSKKRRMKERGSYFYLVLTFILIFVLGMMLFYRSVTVFGSSQKFIIEPRILIALVVSLVLVTVAFLYDIKRFYGHALLMMLLFSIGGLVPIKASYMYIISGTIIIVTGIKYMIAFIQKYPKQESIIESNGV